MLQEVAASLRLFPFFSLGISFFHFSGLCILDVLLHTSFSLAITAMRNNNALSFVLLLTFGKTAWCFFLLGLICLEVVVVVCHICDF